MSVVRRKAGRGDFFPAPRKGTGYSIWLTPDADLSSRLDSIFLRMASIPDATVPLNPHVTIAGSLKCGEAEVFRFTRQAAEIISAASISFLSSGKQNDYFRSFYLKADVSSPLLVSLRNFAVKKFPQIKSRLFLPHLSLAYGFHPAVSSERRILSGLFFPIQVHFRRLCVVRTQGSVSDWRLTGSFPLKESSGK